MIIRFVLFLFIYFALQSTVHTQFVKNFGLKAGPTITGIFTKNNGYETGSINKFSFDAGAYAEFLDLKKTAIAAELHFSSKGINYQSAVYSAVLEPGDIALYSLDDHFNYLSLTALFKYKFYNGKESVFYSLIGPRLDMKLSNSRSINENSVILRNNKFELGGSFGTGIEFKDGLILELRYEPNFTNTYTYANSYISYSKRHTSIMLLLGLNLKSLL
jgi:hypothetical protein